MKKFLLIVCAMTLAVAASAQDHRSLGIRGGIGGGQISYEMNSNAFGGDFLEGELGFFANKEVMSFSLDALTNTIFWSNGGGLNAYYGYGLGAGLHFSSESMIISAAALGQVGIEYNFEALPLQLSLDYRPAAGLQFGTTTGIYLNWIGLCAGIRYRF